MVGLHKPTGRTLGYVAIAFGVSLAVWAIALAISALVVTSSTKPHRGLPGPLSANAEGQAIPRACFGIGASNYAPQVDEQFYIDADLKCLSPATPTINLGSGSIVKAELSGPEGVRIDPLYKLQQNLVAGHLNFWSWRVEATKSGRFELAAVVTAYDATGTVLEPRTNVSPSI